MSLFPKKKTGADGATYEETVPLFPRIGRSPNVDTVDTAAGGISELFDKSTNYKSLTVRERELDFGRPNVVVKQAEEQLAELIYQLFAEGHHHSHAHPRSNPQLPPEKVRSLLP